MKENETMQHVHLPKLPRKMQVLNLHEPPEPIIVKNLKNLQF